MVTRAAHTSLTGASVPMGDLVLDMTEQTRIGELEKNAKGEDIITVQPGVILEELQKRLNTQGLFLPSAPTYTFATIGGIVATDAAGARSYKYGKTRQFVEGLTLVLSSGEVLDINRGEHFANPPDENHPDNYYFELETTNGEVRTIPVPTYTMPDVPKISTGYYAKPGMDFIDLLIGAEGTLGVITDVKLKVIKEPKTAMALISCESEEQAMDLIAQLREQEPEKRETYEPGGISAVEYIGLNAVKLIRAFGNSRPPKNANALVLVQVESPDGNDESLSQMAETCDQLGIQYIGLAEPNDRSTKERFIRIREDVPTTVNDLVGRLGSTKVGADPCVQPKDLKELMRIYREGFDAAGLQYFAWGHGEGNIHFNAIPQPEQISAAQQVILDCGKTVIRDLGGTGMAEHGVGKNKIKQKLLVDMYGEEGIAQMKAVKQALDPEWKLASGNLFQR